jgi:hypothetical protein
MPLAEDGSTDDAAPEDDTAAVERAFVELVAGYHLTADRPDPLAPATEPVVDIEHFIPPPVEPLPRPGLPALVGWIGIGYACVFVLLTAMGVRLPASAGWLAIVCFVGSFAILITRLPRSRPPGDGAVL